MKKGRVINGRIGKSEAEDWVVWWPLGGTAWTSFCPWE